jgi:hypothetical protein
MNELTRRLLHEQNECTLCWLMQDGAPAATTVSFTPAKILPYDAQAMLDQANSL